MATKRIAKGDGRRVNGRLLSNDEEHALCGYLFEIETALGAIKHYIDGIDTRPQDVDGVDAVAVIAALAERGQRLTGEAYLIAYGEAGE
jgi:hypothetical protein